MRLREKVASTTSDCKIERAGVEVATETQGLLGNVTLLGPRWDMGNERSWRLRAGKGSDGRAYSMIDVR